MKFTFNQKTRHLVVVAMFFLISTADKIANAEFINHNPASPICGETMLMNIGGLDANISNYSITLIGLNAGERTLETGIDGGLGSNTYSVIFDVENSCPDSGGIVVPSNTYDIALTYVRNDGSTAYFSSGITFTLLPAGSLSCSLIRDTEPPLWDTPIFYHLENATPSTTYRIEIDGNTGPYTTTNGSGSSNSFSVGTFSTDVSHIISAVNTNTNNTECTADLIAQNPAATVCNIVDPSCPESPDDPNGVCCGNLYGCSFDERCEDLDGDGIGTCVLSPGLCLSIAGPPPYDGPIIDFDSLLLYAYELLQPVVVLFIGLPRIIYSGYKLKTSDGDPAKIKQGKSDFGGAISATLLAALGVTVLRVGIQLALGITI